MQVTIVRCQNGVVAWNRKLRAPGQAEWICARDNFTVRVPADIAGAEQFLLAVAQHSTQLAGAISQVVQLDL